MNIILYTIFFSSVPVILKGLPFEPGHDEFFTNTSKQEEEKTLVENGDGDNMLSFHGMMQEYLQSKNISISNEQPQNLRLLSSSLLFDESSENSSELMVVTTEERIDERVEGLPGIQDVYNLTYKDSFTLNKTSNDSEVNVLHKEATSQENISNGTGTITETADKIRSTHQTGTGTTHHGNEEIFESKIRDPYQFHIAPIVIYYDDENKTMLERTQSRERTSNSLVNETIFGVKIKSDLNPTENILEDEEENLQNKLDPRKESCLQIFDDCFQNEGNFSSGRDCFIQCGRSLNESYTANYSTEIRFPEDDTTISFDGETSSEIELDSKFDSPVFDFLFNLRTFQTDTQILSIEQGETRLEVVLKTGKLGTRFLCQNSSEEFFMKIGGIQDGGLYMCYIFVDQKKSELIIQVNERRENFVLFNETLNEICKIFVEGKKANLVFGGGTEKGSMIPGDIRSGFIGCISNASMFIGSKFVPLTSSEDVQIIQLFKTNAAEECFQSMKMKSRVCSNEMECEETENRVTCYHDEPASTITLNGFNYLSYRLYFWENRKQTFSNEFSFSFKTVFKDAILFYITGENSVTPERFQHLSITLTEEEKLSVSLDSGAELISVLIGNRLCDNSWHDFKIRHKNNKIQLILDGISEIRDLDRDDKLFFSFDPLVFVGGFPNLVKDCSLRPKNISYTKKRCEEINQKYFYNLEDQTCRNISVYNCEDEDKTEATIFDEEDECLETCYIKGLSSYKSFSGCFKNIIVNGEEVVSRTSQVRQIDFKGKAEMIQADCDCNMEEESVVSFLTYDSFLELYHDSSNGNFSISFKVKTGSGKLIQGLVYVQNGVYPWQLRFEDQTLKLTLSTPEKVYLQIPEVAEEQWLEIALIFGGKNVELIVDDKSDAYLSDNDIIIDDKLAFNGFIGCLKSIVIDGNPQDIRSYFGTSFSGDIVGGCQETILATAEECSPGSFCSVQRTFDCKNEIYGGNCNLVKYRKSCEEYRLLGYEESGQFIIDSDGEGPLNPTEVFCEYHKNGDTFTVVDHNIPPRFTNVKNKAKHFLVDIQYREFTADGLRKLISTSEECHQDVKFSCGDKNTPYKKVSFSSAWLNNIDYLGDIHFGVCHCTGFEDCYQTVTQNSSNSDQRNKNGYRIINQTALPILQLKMQREETDSAPYSEPNLTLGKLYCKNYEINNEAISFLSSKSSLILSPWIEGELLLKFRTYSSRGNIFYQPSVNRNTPFIRASLLSGNTVSIQYGTPDKIQDVIFTAAYPLNEGQWNILWIDVVENSFRIILNEQIKFSHFNKENIMHLMDGYFIFGNVPIEYRKDSDMDIENGLIGCYIPIRMNNKALNSSGLVLNSYKSPEISLGCQGACDDNPCQNGGTCLEKWTSYECACANPFAHLGANCENNMNINAVTFFSSTEAVYYNSGFIDESVSPLTSNFTFNIKTNEAQCILFVAMDYVQNIIQIHLENSTTVVVLLNFGDELQELQVNTGDYSLNQGHSVQISVERYQNRTDLLVFTRGQTFSSSLDRGVTLITEEDYKQYPYEVQNHLIQYQHSFTVPEKYFLIFIGGVKSNGATTNLPGLIGCFRGFRINETIMNFTDVNNWNLGYGVTEGCKSKCEESSDVCRNGGECLDTFSTTAEQGNFVCNCEGTSYVGLHCDEETAYTFNGRDDGIGLMGWSFSYEDSLKISFAFERESSESESSLLLFLNLNNTRSSESENISIVLAGERILLEGRRGQENIYLKNDVEEGKKRHYVEVVFNSSEIQLSVDGNVVSFFGHFTSTNSSLNESVKSSTKNSNETGLIIGGAPVDLLQKIQEDLKNFKGCLSNMKISSRFEDFSPLEDYQNGENFVRFGLPKFGKCSVFYEEESGPIFYDFSKISTWKAPEPDIKPVALQSAVRSVELSFESSTFYTYTTTDVSNVTEFEYDTSNAKIWPWALLGSVFFLMVLLLLVLVLKRCCRKSETEEKDLERADSESAPKKPVEPVEEALPLLEREPSCQRSRANNSIESVPYNLTPSESIKKNLLTDGRESSPLLKSSEEVKPISETPNESRGTEDVLASKTPEQSSKPIAIPLNSINRDSKSNIPFKNQLSSDANGLRHIDSSSSEDSIPTLPYNPSEKKPSNIDLTVVDTEDNNESTDESNDDPDFSNSERRGNPNIEQNVDMKRFYLSRKASEPPKLPPKSK